MRFCLVCDNLVNINIYKGIIFLLNSGSIEYKYLSFHQIWVGLTVFCMDIDNLCLMEQLLTIVDNMLA